MQNEVTVIVPVWNGERDIAKCLSALVAQSLPPHEILVVDNGSTDASARVAAEFPTVRVITESQPGSYAARNAGIAAARTEYLAFTDADCVPGVDWLKEGVGAARRQRADLFAGPVRLFPESQNISGATKYERLFAFDHADVERTGRCVTANWFCQRSTFSRYGSFDAALRSGGDFKLSSALLAAGGRISYVPDMVVHHPARATFHAIQQKKRRTLGGRWQETPSRFRVLRVFAAATREMLRKLLRTGLAKGYSLVDKGQIALVVVGVWFAEILEIARLAIGGVPRRA